jgi:hypothetical protein
MSAIGGKADIHVWEKLFIKYLAEADRCAEEATLNCEQVDGR